MIESFKRFRLQRKGLSCGKKRRERGGSGLQSFLRSSPIMAAIVLASAGLFLGWLVLYRPALGAPFVDEPTKAVLVMMMLFLGAVLNYSVGQPESFQRNSRLLLVFLLLALHLAIIKGLLAFVEDHFLTSDFKVLLLPLGLAPMALTVLLGRGHGMFATLFISLWGCLMVAETRLLPWLMTSLATGTVAVAAAHHADRRKDFLRAGLLVGITAFSLALLFGHLHAFQATGDESWTPSFYEALVVLAVNLATGIVVSSLLPPIEAIFKITTASTWVELADLNHPLLRRMTLEAPGTYHHSQMVANLAEAAAEAVGANSLLTRVCSYFHDIGKLKNPDYFIENQPHDANPHDSMTPSMSALVVISHVKDGVDLALRHKLCREIIDVIEQHHGTSLAWYFFQRAQEKRKQIRALAAQDKAHETDVPEVEESSFRYPGPKPQFRESAIIALADPIESASRSLEKPTPQKIDQLVGDIIRMRLLDGQLDECDLTLAEIEVIRKTFVTTLRSMLHKRVAYGNFTEADAKSASGPPPGGPATSRFQVVRKPGEAKPPPRPADTAA